MHTETPVACNCHVNIESKILHKINSIKKYILLSLLLIILCFSFITRFNNVKNKFNNIAVSDFRYDLTILSETASVIEAERTLNKYPEQYKFGSDGRLINADELMPGLSEALMKISDLNGDGILSKEEISSLGIMKLNQDAFKNELNKLQLNLKSADRNLSHYLILTKGKYAGTILYNGPIKYIDSDNKINFGLELIR